MPHKPVPESGPAALGTNPVEVVKDLLRSQLPNKQFNMSRRAAIEAWNEYRRQSGIKPLLTNISAQPGTPVDANKDLAGIDLSQASLEDVRLSGVNLAGANLSGATLNRVVLDGANLNGATLVGATALDTDFSRVEIRSLEWLSIRWYVRLWAGIAWGVNWGTVRAIGNLQILTKVSYAMLVLVPLLAAIWPQVRNWYSERAFETTKQAEELIRRSEEEFQKAKILSEVKEAEDRLNAPEHATDAANARSTVAAVAKRVKEITDFADRGARTLAAIEQLVAEKKGVAELKSAFAELKDAVHSRHDPVTIELRAEEYKRRGAKTREKAEMLQRTANDLWLPWAWVLAFAAAVCVILGHLIYQMATPVLVREQTADEFAEERWTRAIINNVVQQDEVVRALQELREAAEDQPHTRHPQLVFRHGRVIFFPSNPAEYKQQDGSPPPILRPLIEEGAKAQYNRERYQAYQWAWVSVTLYVLGGLLILCNLCLQCLNVAHARGF